MERDPDAVMLRYAELRETLSAPPGAHPFERQGVRWAERCSEPRCGARSHRPAFSRRLGRYVERCTHGHEWPGEDVDAPRGQVQGGRRSAGFDHRYAELTTLERWIAQIPTRERTLYMLFLEPRRGGYENAAARANGLALGGGGWTVHHARRAVRCAREALERAMRGAPRSQERARVGA